MNETIKTYPKLENLFDPTASRMMPRPRLPRLTGLTWPRPGCCDTIGIYRNMCLTGLMKTCRILL